jgi:hypothetical protein
MKMLATCRERRILGGTPNAAYFVIDRQIMALFK